MFTASQLLALDPLRPSPVHNHLPTLHFVINLNINIVIFYNKSMPISILFALTWL